MGERARYLTRQSRRSFRTVYPASGMRLAFYRALYHHEPSRLPRGSSRGALAAPILSSLSGGRDAMDHDAGLLNRRFPPPMDKTPQGRGSFYPNVETARQCLENGRKVRLAAIRPQTSEDGQDWGRFARTSQSRPQAREFVARRILRRFFLIWLSTGAGKGARMTGATLERVRAV